MLAVALPLAVLGWGLRRVLPTLGSGLWGPADPFLNGDFNGGWWLWWASSEAARGGAAGWSLLDWPHGASLAPVIPNPGDMLLLGLSGPPTVAAWNGVQALHLVLLLVSTVVLARAFGARWWAAGAAASLVAASPILLHEVAGGRPSNLVVWPGLLALACLVRGRGVAAGLLAALQGVAYAWHGLVLVLVGLPLLRSRRVITIAVVVGALAVAPYAAWLARGLSAVPTDLPAAGYTHLPLAGLVGLDAVPPRFRLHPLLLVLGLVGLRAGWRPLLAGGIGLVLALGPEIETTLGHPLATGPLAWLAWALPPVNRMHHPLRATLLALPLIAAALALGLSQVRGGRWLAVGVVVAGLWNHGPMDEATTYDQRGGPPFAELDLPSGPVVDLLGMHHRTVLSLQTVHGQPVLEPLWFQRPRTGAQGQVERLVRTGRADPGLWDELAAGGFEHVLVLDRFGTGEGVRVTVERALGPPVAEGVYALPAADP